MKRKFIFSVLTIISLIALTLSAAFMFACGKSEDSLEWNLSAGVTAKFSDNGKYGFILTVEGNGAMPDYSSKKDAPWYGRSGRVTDIVISEGITAIGANAFTDIKAKSVIIPKTAASIGENSFNEQTMICAYTQVSAPQNLKVYIYSEGKPTSQGDYWHTVNDIITKWPEAGTETKKILFIGNSFTYYNDMPSIFGEIANSLGASVEVDSITQGSQTLSNWVNLENAKGAELDAKLKATNDYDIIIIQEQSTRPLNNYEQFLAGAKTLKEKIANTQTDCKIYLYSTWGYASQAESKHITIPEMEFQLRTAYINVAAEIGATVSFVGKAFTYAYENHTDINLYNAQDNMHPSYAGSYLSACVHVATILGLDPRTTTFVGDLGESTASILRNVAYSTVSVN